MPPKKFTQKHPATLADVAAAAGVAKGTASEALRGLGRVAPSTRRKVEAVALRLGYRPDPLASELASLRSRSSRKKVRYKVVIVAAHEPFCPFKAALIKALQDEVIKRGYDCTSAEFADRERWLEQVAGWRRRGVRGLIILPSYRLTRIKITPEDVQDFSLLAIGLCPLELQTHCVKVDATAAFCLALETARVRGYRRIGAILHRHEPRILEDDAREGLLEVLQKRWAPAVRLFRLLEDFASDEAGQRERISAWLRSQRPDVVVGHYAAGEMVAAAVSGVPFIQFGGASLQFEGVSLVGPEISFLAAGQMDDLIRRGERGVPERPCITQVAPQWYMPDESPPTKVATLSA